MKANYWRKSAIAAVFVLGLIAVALGPFAGLASAHNRLLKTEPAAQAAVKASPARVTFWFVEKPDLTVTKVAVKGPAGPVGVAPAHAVSEKVIAADFKSKLAPGQYTVDWQTAGDDGHISKGEFSFSVAAQ